MPVPKKKTSTSKRDSRRSHHALTPKNLVKCEKCGEWKEPHIVCASCGHYRGKNYEVK